MGRFGCHWLTCRRYWLHWRALWRCAAMRVATLVLCPYANSWPHTSARVTGLQPFALASAHPRHARHWSHHRISGVDCTASHDPTNRPYCLVRPRAAGPSVSRASPPLSASSLMLSARATFLCPATRPKSSFVHWRATCNVLDLPGTPFLHSTRFHYALS